MEPSSGMSAAEPRSASAVARAAALLPPLARDGIAQLAARWHQHLLSLVGIVWGAAAVVLLLALGAGFYDFLDLGFKKTGDRYTGVEGEYATSESGGLRPGREVRLTNDDLERLRASVGSAVEIAAEIQHGSVVLRSPRRTRTGILSAATPDLRHIKVLRVARGRFYDDADVEQGRSVAVLGANLPDVFFGAEDPIGRTLKVQGRPFRVIGVLERKGQQLVINNGLHDDMVFVPLTAGQRVLGRRHDLEAVLMNPRRRTDGPALEREIRWTLAPFHHVAPDDPGAYRVQSVSEFSGPLRRIAGGLTLLLGFVGTTTLSIAGIGVANLMIAVVNARRSELAVRRACGARRADLVLQLLVETTVVVLAGGLLGVAVALGIVWGLASIPLPEMIPRPRISPSVLVITLGVLVAVGLASGVAPARIASRVDPASALRVT